MVAIKEGETDLVLVAMQLDEQLGGRGLPLHEMEIIAFYHPEEETCRLVGKAVVMRIMKSEEPEEKKAAKLSYVSTETRYHMEAREDAGKALCAILKNAGTWERLCSIAIDSCYPTKTRDMAASDFLDNPGGEGVAAVLGCAGVSEKLREEKGFMIVREAMERGDRALIERLGAVGGLPRMLEVCVRSIVGPHARKPPFAKERNDPSKKGLLGVISTEPGKK